MNLRSLFHASMRHVAGNGWMYRLPRYYDRIIEKRFGLYRDRAYRYFLQQVGGLDGSKTCLDVACGTGLTSVWMAQALPEISVIGIDSNIGMLELAKRRARKLGVGDRCRFLRLDATTVTLSDLSAPGVDVVTCSLGYSVIPGWEAAFSQTYELLPDNGAYAIFDQYEEDLLVPDFASDQTRQSWRLVEDRFAQAETKWIGDRFISFGKGKK